MDNVLAHMALMRPTPVNSQAARVVGLERRRKSKGKKKKAVIKPKAESRRLRARRTPTGRDIAKRERRILQLCRDCKVLQRADEAKRQRMMPGVVALVRRINAESIEGLDVSLMRRFGEAVAVVIAIMTGKEPNQALQPTRMLVTDRADARSAPSTRVADL